LADGVPEIDADSVEFTGTKEGRSSLSERPNDSKLQAVYTDLLEVAYSLTWATWLFIVDG